MSKVSIHQAVEIAIDGNCGLGEAMSAVPVAVAVPIEHADEMRGGLPNNIPLAISNSEITTGGEDTVEVSLFVQWPSSFKEMAKKLDEFKEAAQVDGCIGCYLSVGEDKWAVAPTGFRQGDGTKKGPMYRWRLSWGGFVLGIQNKSEPGLKDQVGNVWLRIGSETLMLLDGVGAAFTLVKTKLSAMGGTVIKDKLSKIDACADLPGVNVCTFTSLFRKGYYVSRARDRHEFFDGIPSGIHGSGRVDTGFSIGKNIRLNVYNKKLEVRNQPTKEAIIQDRRWGGEVSEATRVEFSLRREALRSFEIDTVEQWEFKKSGVLKYLCEDWFRLTEGEVNLQNTSRACVATIWKVAYEKFREWTTKCGDTEKATRIKKDVLVNPQALVRQAAGCLGAAMAALGIEIRSTLEFQKVGETLIQFQFTKRDFSALVERKRRNLLARKPGFGLSTVDRNGELSSPYSINNKERETNGRTGKMETRTIFAMPSV